MDSLTHHDSPWVVTFAPDDALETKLKKAAHVKPSAAQLAWMEKEYIAFVHFGPNTFTGRQWGSGNERVEDYSPDAIDVAQWCKLCAEVGMKMMIFTAKHHDGFCQWHTQTTDFSINNSQINTDIMSELSRYCEKNRVELGVYLSPWDMYQRERGLWNTEQYNEYFLKQLNELLSNYGKISEVWFDGACSDYEIWKAVPSYTPEKWYELIEKKQPDAVVRLYDPYSFATEEEWRDVKQGRSEIKWSGKGVRWVGNEGGLSRNDEWSVQPIFDREIAENATWSDLGEEKYYENAVGAIWYPLEVNTVVQNQWFWNEKTSVSRSLSDLIEVYYHSIGNNGVLLLNVSPDVRGVIGDDQIKRLTQLKEYVDYTFRHNLASGAAVSTDSEKSEHLASNILDGNKKTYWMPNEPWSLESSAASVTISLAEEVTFDNVMLQEFIREGQRVARWSMDVWDGEDWHEAVQNKTIGYKSIKRFASITTSKVRINILRSWDTPMLSAFGLYLSDTIPVEETKNNAEVILSPIEPIPSSLAKGLHYSCYDKGLQSASLLDSVFAVKLVKAGIAEKIDASCADSNIGYSLVYSGYLYVPADDDYTLRLESSDGSLLYLGDALLINNDEPHETKAMLCTITLRQGYYPVKVLYTSFRHSGLLRLYWRSGLFNMREIDAAHLYCERDQ